MTANEQIIHNFYQAFQKGDVKAMQESYADNVVFKDDVFGQLNSIEVKAMWQMLLSRNTDLSITFNYIKALDENRVAANWEAKYNFSASKNKVLNKVSAEFVIGDGKIVQHIDRFNFYKWSRQAFGGGGLLLGWTDFFQQRVRLTAKKQLAMYMRKTSQP